jgi:hypothetical protein
MIPAALPPLYAGWLDQLLDGPIPGETNATCDSCAMLVPESSDGTATDPGYNPETKCCTYMPELWNFLVGRILTDEHPDAAVGRATVEARIDNSPVVTPLGLGRSHTYKLLYSTGGGDTFGQSRSLRCPHYINERGGLCGVWRHRESTCATWFCKYVRGKVGFDFWANLHQLLRATENTLAGWALLELGMDRSALAHIYEPHRDVLRAKLTGRDVDGAPNPVDRQAAWGNWRGREREFFQECARLVSPLSWNDVQRIGGAPLAIYAGLVRDAYAKLMSDEIPARPIAALVQITPRGRDRVRIATYSGIDALEMPASVANLISYFDGRPVAETVDEISRTEGVIVDPSFIRKLADFGVMRDQPVAPPA